MSTPLKKERKQVRVYVDGADADNLEELKAVSGQTDTWIINTLLSSALAAVRQNGGFRIPLRFHLEEAASHAEPLRAARPKLKAA